MASDLSLIPDASESHTIELTVQGLGNGLAERRFTDTWRSIEAKDTALVIFGELAYCQELYDPLLD